MPRNLDFSAHFIFRSFLLLAGFWIDSSLTSIRPILCLRICLVFALPINLLHRSRAGTPRRIPRPKGYG